MKKDLSYQEATFHNWKDKVLPFGIRGINKTNSKLICDYITDMETGQNVSNKSRKGARGYGRLNVCKNKITQIGKMLEKRGIKNMSEMTENEAHLFFHDIYKGNIKREDGKDYTCPSDFVRIYKAFFHWFMKINRKKGIFILDITEDLEVKKEAPHFVYFTKEQLEEMLPYFLKEEQLLCKFLFDSVVRFPTECSSIKVKDIYEQNGDVWVNMAEEISKSIGRTFNLLYCGEAIKEYIKDKSPEDYLFSFLTDQNRVYAFNKKLKKVALQVLGDKISHPMAKGKFSEITGYDFRHAGIIHLRILAQKNNNISLDSIRQRMGDKTFEMINWYTNFIGLNGEIKKEGLLVQEDKTKLEREVEANKQKVEALAKLYLQLSKQLTGKEMTKEAQEIIQDREVNRAIFREWIKSED